MIVDCPHCYTSNSGNGHTGMDGTVVCRNCGRHFQAPELVTELGGNTNPQRASAEHTNLMAYATPMTTVVAQIVTSEIQEPEPEPKAASNHEGSTRIAHPPTQPHDVTVVRQAPSKVHAAAAGVGERPELTGKTGVMSQRSFIARLSTPKAWTWRIPPPISLPTGP